MQLCSQSAISTTLHRSCLLPSNLQPLGCQAGALQPCKADTIRQSVSQGLCSRWGQLGHLTKLHVLASDIVTDNNPDRERRRKAQKRQKICGVPLSAAGPLSRRLAGGPGAPCWPSGWTLSLPASYAPPQPYALTQPATNHSCSALQHHVPTATADILDLCMLTCRDRQHC